MTNTESRSHSRLIIYANPKTGRLYAPSRQERADSGMVPILLSGDLALMHNAWFFIPGYRDGQMSGIFADWLEEHPEALGGLTPAVSAWLRARLTNPAYSVVVPNNGGSNEHTNTNHDPLGHRDTAGLP